MNYLTSEQITELRNKRAEWVNDSDLSDLKALLKVNGYEIDINMNTNYNNVFDIIYKKYEKDILTSAEWKEFKKNTPYLQYGSLENEKTAAIFKYLEVLNPKLNKVILNTNVTINSKYIIHAVNQIKEMTVSIKNFDTANFILNKDFDFAPYKVEANNSKLIDNTIAIDKAVSKFFESFTKELNQEQKQIVSKNLFQTINFFVLNSNPAVIKEKGNEFQSLMEYINTQSI